MVLVVLISLHIYILARRYGILGVMGTMGFFLDYTNKYETLLKKKPIRCRGHMHLEDATPEMMHHHS